MEKLTLHQLNDKLKRLTLPKIRLETEKIIRNNPQLVFRKQDEFRHGENPDGSTIGLYRSEEYRMMKQQMNPLAGGTVDLILTGSTIKNLQVVSLGNGEFKLYSTDHKWNDLVAKYGKQIEVISLKHFEGLQKHDYAPLLIERLRQIMG